MGAMHSPAAQSQPDRLSLDTAANDAISNSQIRVKRESTCGSGIPWAAMQSNLRISR